MKNIEGYKQYLKNRLEIYFSKLREKCTLTAIVKDNDWYPIEKWPILEITDEIEQEFIKNRNKKALEWLIDSLISYEKWEKGIYFLQVFAKPIDINLVPVRPMLPPIGMLTYLNYFYSNTKFKENAL